MILHKSVVVKVTQPELISVLSTLHQVLHVSLREDILKNPHIQPAYFSDYRQSHRANFKKTLGGLMNKSYLNWPLSQKERAFRMLAEYVRQTFKSLQYKIAISEILAKYHFDENAPEIKTELNALNLFPTICEIKNICRSQKVAKKEDWLENTPNLVLDFTTQDSQTITQPDLNKAIYQLYTFKKDWIAFAPAIPQYFQTEVDILIQQGRLVKYAKPKFFQDEHQRWKAVITIEYQAEKSKPTGRVAGVDLGRVKPFSAVVLDGNQVLSHEIKGKKEAVRVKLKLDKTTANLNDVYRKLNRYAILLTTSKDNAFIKNIANKQARLLAEKRYLRRKNKRLRKHLAYLCARDLRNRLEKWGVSLVKMERLNWVEKGGKWDYSQMQTIIKTQLLEKGIQTQLVSAAFTSSQNPFRRRQHLGKKLANRQVEFQTQKGQYRIDRDIVAAMNIALKETQNTLDFYQAKKQLSF